MSWVERLECSIFKTDDDSCKMIRSPRYLNLLATSFSK
jgi:hypothetical protein